MRNLLDAVLKRILDVVGASLGLVLLLPLFLVVAILIKRSSPGPIFFRQRRIGLHGKPFWILKFRTMRPDAETVLRSDPQLWEAYVSHNFKLPEGQDPRITPVGRWLRRTSLDELPQLWNVLVGDMSLVGPRPLLREEIDTWYGSHAEELLSARPGMTGLWQVNGRSAVDYPERATLELQYVGTRSVWGDVQLLLRTVRAVVSGQGAH